MKQILSLLLPLFLMPFVSTAQEVVSVSISSAKGIHNINKYADQPGFAGSVSEYLFQDSKGYVWACTRAGLNRLDGKEIVNFTTDDGLVNNTPRCVAEDENGLLWIGTISGLSVYDGENFFSLGVENGLSHEQIWSVLPCKDGGMLIGTSVGIDHIYDGEIKGYHRHDTILSANSVIRYMNYDSQGNLWYGTGNEVAMLKDGKSENVIKIMDSFASQGWAEAEDGSIYLGSWNPYLVKYKDGEITPIEIGTPINSIKIDAENNIWLATWEKGLLCFDGKTSAKQFDLKEGLTISSIWNLMIDAEGTIWCATFGAGAEQLVNERFSVYSSVNGLPSDIVNDIGLANDHTIWLATEAGVARIKPNGEIRIFDERDGMHNSKVQGLVIDDEGDVWFVLYEGTRGLYKIENDKVIGFDQAGGFDILQATNGDIWWGTDNRGAFRLDKKGVETQFRNPNGTKNRILEVKEGPDQKIWLGVYYGGWQIYDYETNEWHENVVPDYLAKESGFNINFDKWGFIWTNLGEKGLYRCELKDNKLIVLDSLQKQDGLLSNKLSSQLIEGDIMWITSDYGLTKFNLNAYYQDRTIELNHLTMKHGFEGEGYSRIVRNSANDLLIGTSKGLLIYRESKDKKITTEPFTLISEIKLNKLETDWRKKDAVLKKNSAVPASINLRYDDNHLTFIFKGISFSAPEEVRFQYILEGFDNDWSPMTPHGEIAYSNIAPGEYVFKVKSMNIDGVWDTTPEEVQIHISPPYWQTWWFKILIVLLLAIIIITIFKLRLRKLNKAKELLEQKVDERTQELKGAYHEIEEKNIEITDSISYAKRIQTAILPPLADFELLMDDRFVLYKPKDIVAGDFYWLNKAQGKHLFAVGDCTGHGVPGAMVSVVCVAALNRSVAEFGLSKPAEILEKTRELVLETFEKSEEDVKDGMDISLCSWDKETGQLEFCGANNNLYIIKDDELTEIKADKQPIGRYEFAKPFTNHEVLLDKGTCVYLFSDGFADQFGGEKGKKMKYKAFKEFLLEQHSLPMTDQNQNLDREFEAWRGEFEQVDDVCVIGVRV